MRKINKLTAAVMAAAMLLCGYPHTAAKDGSSGAAVVSAAEYAPVEPALNAKAQKITNRTVIKYDWGRQNFKHNALRPYYLYDFSSTYSIGYDATGSYHAFSRMYYGAAARVDSKKKRVYFQPYNDYPDDVKIVLKSVAEVSDTASLNLKKTWNEQYIDYSKLPDGIYMLKITLENKTAKKENNACVYVYISGGKAYLCSVKSMEADVYKLFKARRDKFWKLYDGDKTLSLKSLTTTDNLCYPQLPYYYSDTEYWIKFSDKLVKSDWPDDRKMFAIYKWMTENLAFDYYRADVIDMSRQSYTKDYSSKWAISNTKVGVCYDFVNVFATMCRAQGIPCTSADTKTHTFNMVYINGSWLEIDISGDVAYGCRSKDYSKKNWFHLGNYYDNFCPITYSEMNYLDGWITTYAILKDEDTRPTIMSHSS